MRRHLRPLFVLTYLLAWLGGISQLFAAATGEIIVGAKAGATERHAADELRKYIQAITGENWPVATAVDESSTMLEKMPAIVLGRVETNEIIALLSQAEKIKLTRDYPGESGFIIRSVNWKGRDLLVIGGCEDIGTLYGVYHYLEEVCGCGFFADGEYIPQRKDVPLRDLNFAEKACVKWRAWNSDMGHWCIKKYQSKFWDRKEWRFQLDWMAKRKLNLTWYLTGATHNMAGGGAAREIFDLGPLEPKELVCSGWPQAWSWPQEYRDNLFKDTLADARLRGVKMAYIFNYGDVPIEFYRKHPDLAKWVGPDSYDQVFIHPDDPKAFEITAQYLKKLFEQFGTDHIYFTSPYVEFSANRDPAEALRVKTASAKKLCQLLATVDPDYIWLTENWDFFFNNKIWTPQAAASYLTALPQDHMILYSAAEDFWDQWYKKYNYYEKVTWGFGAIHQYAGDDEWVRGHRELISKFKQAMAEKSPNPCNGIFLVPELTNCDIVYFHLMTWLGWNPEKMEYEDSVSRYCRHRYGAACASAMPRAWLTLLAALPPYGLHRRAYDYPDIAVDNFAQGAACVAGIQQAMKLALDQADSLRDNPLFVNDVFNFAREYAGNLFNYQYSLAKKAALEGDKPLFAAAHAGALTCMDVLEKLLSTRPDLSLQQMINEVMAVPGTNPTTPKSIRRGCVNMNYSTNDVYEQFAGYYQPKIAGFLAVLAEQVKQDGKASSVDYSAVFGAKNDPIITQQWIDRELDSYQLQRFNGDTLGAVRQLVSTLESVCDKTAIAPTATAMILQEKKMVIDEMSFSDKIELCLNSATSQADIYFTTDDSEPTAASKKYTSPVAIAETTTLKARAFKANGLPSLTATFHLWKDGEHKPVDTQGLAPGLKYEVYKGQYRQLPDFNRLQPAATGVSETLNDSVISGQASVAVRLTGFLAVPATGIYTFTTCSDDGDKLYIDDELVVNNDGYHPATTQSGRIYLAAGTYPITAIFYNDWGPGFFEVNYEGPGVEKQAISPQSLFHRP